MLHNESVLKIQALRCSKHTIVEYTFNPSEGLKYVIGEFRFYFFILKYSAVTHSTGNLYKEVNFKTFMNNGVRSLAPEKFSLEKKKTESKDAFSAGEQALGYFYQPRLALLKLFTLPESTAIYIEKEDDVEFDDTEGNKFLASLKHKSVGSRMSNLDPDFWKSVRIWLVRYEESGYLNSFLNFFLFSTSEVSSSSFLRHFLTGGNPSNSSDFLNEIEAKLTETTSQIISPIRDKFGLLTKEQKVDFLSRITIFDNSPRIQDIPSLIMDQHMRSIRSGDRSHVFEALEGWWNNQIIEILCKLRNKPITGIDLSDKLRQICEMYRQDNLPITFWGQMPDKDVDVEKDNRLFIRQLRAIDVHNDRIKTARLDYYRAFEQRAAWAREHLLIDGEIEEYEERLIDEWQRYHAMKLEEIAEEAKEDDFRKAGRDIFNWSQLLAVIRIRDRVSEPYVMRGSFHILANASPHPKVHWHPKFLESIQTHIGVGE